MAGTYKFQGLSQTTFLRIPREINALCVCIVFTISYRKELKYGYSETENLQLEIDINSVDLNRSF